MHRPRTVRALVGVTGLALVAAACGGGSNTNDPKVDPGSERPANAKRGGTLRLKGAGDVDHLDTAAAYYTVSYTILRGLSRQLVSYPTTPDEERRDTPVGDAAEQAEYASADGLTYTFRIRDGVTFDTRSTPPGRQVVAGDFVVGLKRLCDPNNPSGGLVYFQNTIKGFTEFCEGFGKAVKPADPEAKRIAAVRRYIETTQVSGITTPDDRTIVFSLKAPAGDFLNILAMPFASPVAPEVSLKYVADSPSYRRNFVSSGPYKLVEYVAEKSIKLDRNPHWKAESDQLRGAYVDRIEVVEGSDEEPVQQEIEAGTVDLAWDTGVPSARIAQLKDDAVQGLTGSNPRLYANPDGCVAYIVMRVDRKPFDDPRVRQAVNWGIDRSAIVRLAGGPDVQTPHYNVLPPSILGYRPYEAYKTPNDKGDPGKAKSLLAEAGYPNGLKVTFLHRNAGKHPAYAQAHQAALKKAGFDVVLKPVTPAQFYTEYLQRVNNNEWDFAQPGWCPDWAGNGARTFFSPLLDGRTIRDGSTNYSHYDSKTFNAKLDDALGTRDRKAAEAKWAALDKAVMDEAVWAPVMTGKVYGYRHERVRNFVFFPFSNGADVTNVYLDPPTP